MGREQEIKGFGDNAKLPGVTVELSMKSSRYTGHQQRGSIKATYNMYLGFLCTRAKEMDRLIREMSRLAPG